MKIQAPKGTRDFYPQEMAWRRYLEAAWRRVSIRNGFEEVEGPIFEDIELYKVKSGEEIVSQVFHVSRQDGQSVFGLRPEFTPTLARMVAAKANALPKPIKWFCMPNLCRGERPQRGRLREFLQWNVDLLGLDSPLADAETIFTLVDLLRELGLTPQHVKVKVSHRQTVRTILTMLGVSDDNIINAFNLLDRRDKMETAEYIDKWKTLGLDEHKIERFDQMCRRTYPVGDVAHLERSIGGESIADLEALDHQLTSFGIADWCEYDLGIVRGLAYYTGTVYEVHEISGAERAVAGGGRYDKLIELMGGPAMPAVGFGMGDVVLSLVLADKGLLPDNVAPAPDAFVFPASEEAKQSVCDIVTTLRSAGLHARMTYKTTTNVGKLLKEATQHAARFAVIVESPNPQAVTVKNLATGDQSDIPLADLPAHLSA